MGYGNRFATFITTHSSAVIVVMLVATAIIGAGMAQVDQSPGLDQFEFETEEGDALAYIEENFEVDDDETMVQVILRDQDNALSRESFIDTLELQQSLADDPAVADTLAEDPFNDLGSIVATEHMRAGMAADLQEAGTQLEADRTELEGLAGELSTGLNETRDLQTEYEQLNASNEAGEIDDETYDAQAAEIEAGFDDIETNAQATLSDEQFATYSTPLAEARDLQAEIVQTEMAYEAGEISESERDDTVAELGSDIEALYEGIQTQVLGDEFAALQERGEELAEREEEIATFDPAIGQQREHLEDADDDEIEAFVGDLLGPDADPALLAFVPTDYETGETQTDARTMFVSQSTGDEELVEGAAPDRIVDSQLAIDEQISAQFGDDGFAFGVGILSDEINRSMADSLGVVMPFALLFVILVLSIAYRDPLDIVLGVAGIGLVLVWTFGFVGWSGITFNQIMIAVPVLLVGLSIDYAIHVFMRHRERRNDGNQGTRSAMRVVLLGLGAALVWVTVTAVIGFLSNLVSPVAPIRDFGIVSAFGIVATLLIFGILIPAAKISLDDLLEARGWDRRKRAFGTGGGPLTEVLNVGNRLADRIPVAVILVALLLTAGGVYGASQVDTEFNQEDFIADQPPEWMDRLPGQLAPGEYNIKSSLDFVNERFLRQDSGTQILIQGNLTADKTLERMGAAEQAAADEEMVVTLSDGSANVQSPLSSMQSLAEDDPTFNETFMAADTDGDGIPDQDLESVYDAWFDTAPEQAAGFLAQSDDDGYDAARMTVSIQGGASPEEATDATRKVAETFDGGLSATATGQLVEFHIIEDSLFDSVLESLLVTLVAVFAFLMAAYRIVHGSAILGAVTLAPIVLAVAWILGTMYLLEIPFNVITGTITSLTIGLGVAYNIHISERYRLELGSGHGPVGAMRRAVTGTGGALLGSAATTIGGFGVLIFAILPPLQQFGLITALTIFYAFVGSVFVLPSFLRLWTKLAGPETDSSPT